MTDITNIAPLTELLYRHVYGRVEQTKWTLVYCTTEFCIQKPLSDVSLNYMIDEGYTDEQIAEWEARFCACDGHERVVSREIGMLRGFRFRGEDLILVIHPWDEEKGHLSSKTTVRFPNADRLEIWPYFNGFRNHLQGDAKIDVSLRQWNPIR